LVFDALFGFRRVLWFSARSLVFDALFGFRRVLWFSTRSLVFGAFFFGALSLFALGARGRRRLNSPSRAFLFSPQEPLLPPSLTTQQPTHNERLTPSNN